MTVFMTNDHKPLRKCTLYRCTAPHRLNAKKPERVEYGYPVPDHGKRRTKQPASRFAGRPTPSLFNLFVEVSCKKCRKPKSGAMDYYWFARFVAQIMLLCFCFLTLPCCHEAMHISGYERTIMCISVR